MLPYPPLTKPGVPENAWLRALGGTLALLSILLALLGIIVHQRVPDLMLASIVGLFALRVLILWLGDKPQHQRPGAGWSSMDPVMYPMQSPPYPQEQPAPYASAYSRSQPFYQVAPEPHMQQTAPLPPAMPSPAPLPRPFQQENWQYDQRKHGTQQQGGDDHGTA